MKDNRFARDLTKHKGPGLCMYCEAVTRCTLIQSSDSPVLECEEFRTIRPTEADMSATNTLETASDRSSAIAGSRHTDWGLKGLCGNCAIFDTCPFSKDEGGVWRCEEYR